VKSPAPVLLLDRQIVAQSLTLQECIIAVEAAFVAYAQGRALEPGLMHVDAERGEFHIKAGGLRGEQTFFAAKINGGFFRNKSELGIPNIVGLILLSDGRNGTPLAIMESGAITRLRTGAATAVAAKYLARPDSRTVTICGAGTQGEIQFLALKEVLPIEQVFVWSRSGAEALAGRIRSHGVEAKAVTDLGESIPFSDVIVTSTPAKQWYLGREHVRPGTFIAAVGADSPGKQELEPELLAENSVVADLVNQAAHVGELHHCIEAGLMQANQIRGELGAIIAKLAKPRVDEKEIIIFDSTGTALQDTAAAVAVYEKARAAGRGQPFAFWN
jgi:alanine dehydrogenase